MPVWSLVMNWAMIILQNKTDKLYRNFLLQETGIWIKTDLFFAKKIVNADLYLVLFHLDHTDHVATVP